MDNKSKLGLFDVTMIVVSLVIGMGIFKTPATVAQKAGTPGIFFLAWVLGGVIALCGALTYAEIGSRYPVTGGYYKIFSYCYHPAFAFMINGIILVSNAASTSAVALIGAEYINTLILPVAWHTVAAKQVVAIIAVLIFYGVNLLGLKMSARTQNVLTLLKIGMVTVLIFALFGNYKAAPAAGSFIDLSAGWAGYLKAFGISLIAVSFTYGGYQQTINFGGEVKHANKVIPRAIFFGLAIIVSLYLLINYAYFRVIGFENLKTADSIAATLAKVIFGPTGDAVFRILLFFAVLAYVNVQLMSNPRVMYAMGEDGVLPPLFKKKSNKSEVLITALTCFSAISIITLFFSGAFDRILNYTIFLDSFGMTTSAATIFILRKRTRHLDKSQIYSMRLYPLLPVIFISAYLLVCISIIFSDKMAALSGFLIFLGFYPLYKLFSSRWFKKNNL